MESAFANLRTNVDWSAFWEDSAQIEAANGDDGSVSIYSADLPESTSEVSVSAAGETYTFSAETFFQGNRSLVGPLIETALGDSKGETALEDGDYAFLRRFLDVTKANLFFARGVAIVEGPAEALLLPALAQACGRSFSAAGVSVVNVGSVGLFRFGLLGIAGTLAAGSIRTLAAGRFGGRAAGRIGL